MNNKRSDKLRKRLEREREAILISIRKIRFDGNDIETGADDADIAEHTHQEGLTLTLHESETTRLKAVKNALRRLETEEWGFCANCQEPIPEARLEAVPWASLCVRCQDEAEQRTRDSDTRADKKAR